MSTAGKIKIPSKTSPVTAAPVAPAAEGAPVSETQNTAPAAPAPVKLSAEEKKALFDHAFAYDDAVKQLESQIDTVKGQKSVAVKAIYDAVGKGPFQYRGNEISISSRHGTFFFKDYGRRDLETIDS